MDLTTLIDSSNNIDNKLYYSKRTGSEFCNKANSYIVTIVSYDSSFPSDR